MEPVVRRLRPDLDRVREARPDTADDGTLISGLQAFDAWHEDLGLSDSNTRSAALIGLLNAAGPLAGIVIGPVITVIDERWGRRWGIRCESEQVAP